MSDIGGATSVLAAAAEQLGLAGVASPHHDAEALLALVTGVGRTSLHQTGDLTQEQSETYAALVDRRARREPLQHLVGVAPFRYLELAVGPGVFVPRPETEVLAGVAVDELRRCVEAGVPQPRAVDLCTGSGAVALAMVTEVCSAQVTGVEVSADALVYARRNVAALAPTGAEIDLRLGDIADAVDDLDEQVHVVAANPPYIPLSAYESVEPEVRDHDPSLALWSGADGLDAIRVVSEVAARLLVEGGLVACEHADVQAEVAAQIFAASGCWHQVRDHHDLAGRPRFVTARRAPRADPAAPSGSAAARVDVRAGTMAP